MSRIDTPIERENRFVVAEGWEDQGLRMLAMRVFRVSLQDVENILKLDSDDGCVTADMLKNTLFCVFKMYTLKGYVL